MAKSVHWKRDQNAASEEIGMDLAMGMWTQSAAQTANVAGWSNTAVWKLGTPGGLALTHIKVCYTIDESCLITSLEQNLF
jgi:hypothetical protein